MKNTDSPKGNQSQNRLNKEKIVAILSEKVANAKGLIFTNYQGLKHQQIEKLKKSSKKLNAEYITAKNTLFKIALKDKINSQADLDQFREPTATLFIYQDFAAALKNLTTFIKEFNLPKIKFGFLDGQILNQDQVQKIASLPPLPILRAQLLGQMQSPISGLHRTLNWNMQKFVLTLNAIKNKNA